MLNRSAGCEKMGRAMEEELNLGRRELKFMAERKEEEENSRGRDGGIREVDNGRGSVSGGGEADISPGAFARPFHKLNSSLPRRW